MKLIALSGGIASGKSTIARRLAELGAHHIDADLLAREAVEPGSPGLARIVERFGDAVIADNGSLNRAALGEIVFRDTNALQDLNGIVHPEVRRLAEQRLTEIESADPEAVVIYDVPLLLEAKSPAMPWDLVVIAEAPAEVRVERMVGMRGMGREDALRRIENQVSDVERRQVADVIVDTGGSMAHTIEQTDALWTRLSEEPGP